MPPPTAGGAADSLPAACLQLQAQPCCLASPAAAGGGGWAAGGADCRQLPGRPAAGSSWDRSRAGGEAGAASGKPAGRIRGLTAWSSISWCPNWRSWRRRGRPAGGRRGVEAGQLAAGEAGGRCQPADSWQLR